MRRIFVVRVEDDDPELRPHRHRLPQEEADRSRFADARRPQNGKMASDQFADVDFGGNGLVLAQPADFDALAPSKRIDGPKVVGTDSVRGRAEGGKRAHAAMKVRRAGRIVDNFAGQLDRDAGGVDLRRRPSTVVSLDVAYRADQTRGLVDYGDQMSDRPVFFACLER